MLLKFQRRLVIDSDSSDSEQDAQLTHKTHRTILLDLQSKRRQRFKNQLNQHIEQWLQRELVETEQRILTGIMTNHISRIDEEQEKKDLQLRILETL